MQITKTPLFQGISETEVQSLLAQIGAKEKTYKKGDIIYVAGQMVSAMGLVVSGSVTIENDDIWGNKSILDCIGVGHVFAETYSFLSKEPLLVTVVAAEQTKILFLPTAPLLQTIYHPTPCSAALLYNLLGVLAHKNIRLSQRIFHTSSKTIRGRLLSYFSSEAKAQNSLEITIPFPRQQLADYLGVDRSALSHELSKMQKEGLLTYHKNTFSLHNAETFFPLS